MRDKKLVSLDQIPFRPQGELNRLAAGHRKQRALRCGGAFFGAPDRSMAQPGSDS